MLPESAGCVCCILQLEKMKYLQNFMPCADRFQRKKHPSQCKSEQQYNGEKGSVSAAHHFCSESLLNDYWKHVA